MSICKKSIQNKYQYLKKKLEDIFYFCLLIQILLKVIHLTSVMPAKILKIMILVWNMKNYLVSVI